MFFTTLEFCTIAKTGKLPPALFSYEKSIIRYSTQLFHSRLLDTVGYNYLISFKRKWNNCFIKNSYFFTVTFRGNILGFYSALELKNSQKYERKEFLLKP